MTIYLSAAETAKLMRADLKRAFPTVKFSVRSQVYSGGQSVNVSWLLGPTACRVKRICDRYRSAEFDGMQDLSSPVSHEYVKEDGSVESVHYGNDYGSCSRHFGGPNADIPHILSAARWLADRYKLEGPEPYQEPESDWRTLRRNLDQWKLAGDWFSHRAIAMIYARDYLVDADWEPAERVVMQHEPRNADGTVGYPQAVRS